jgi:hypothetical protein
MSASNSAMSKVRRRQLDAEGQIEELILQILLMSASMHSDVASTASRAPTHPVCVQTVRHEGDAGRERDLRKNRQAGMRYGMR